MTNGRFKPIWTEEEKAFLRSNAETPRRELMAAFCARFRPLTQSQFDNALHSFGVKMSQERVKACIVAARSKPLGALGGSGKGDIRVRTEKGMERANRVIWEAANGPVPEGHVLVCLDGDMDNLDPSNWVPMTPGEKAQLKLNGPINPKDADPSLRPALVTLAKLTNKIHRTLKK